MQDASLICRICGNDWENKIYKAQEMMFGFRDEFEYFECNNCGCLQIKNIPQDMSKYYPANYPSFKYPIIIKQNRHDNFLVRYFRHKRTYYALGQKSILGKFLLILRPLEKQLSEYLAWIEKCRADFDSRILDVGCAEGKLLLELAWYGFKNLFGIDPYIEKDIVYANGTRIMKKDLFTEENNYDVIMFHHSFEHMPEPSAVLRKVARLLNQAGYILIRLPTKSSYAWENYGVNWVQIDAPRHFFLHSLKSIEILTNQAGLKIKDIVFDSTDFQFWGSEQYQNDIPFLDEKSYFINPKKSIFSDDDIRRFKLKATELNQQKIGDQVCIYLTKD
jgi:SAM-dependent methyltransferase